MQIELLSMSIVEEEKPKDHYIMRKHLVSSLLVQLVLTLIIFLLVVFAKEPK